MSVHNKRHQLLANSNPILLLTPSASYLSLLINNPNNHTNTSQATSLSQQHQQPLALMTIKSKNIVIESSILFLRQYKRLVKLILDSIESCGSSLVINHSNFHSHYQDQSLSSCSNGTAVLYISNNQQQQQQQQPQTGVHYHHHHHHHHHYHHHHHHNNEADHLTSNSHSLESLEAFLERLETQPRSLKTLARRQVLNRLIEVQKKRHYDNINEFVYLVKNQVIQLRLPKRIQNYLLFID